LDGDIAGVTFDGRQIGRNRIAIEVTAEDEVTIGSTT
jgi:hypothetical protein